MEHTGINLPVGSTLVVDFPMQPGAESEVVRITAEVLPANAASVVENKSISETPVNGRNFVNLVENRNTGQTTLPGNGANARATNGMRTDQNNPLIDGVYDGDIDTGWQNVNGFGFQGGIDPDVLLPLDSIGEINSNAYPRAEYGYHPGNTSNIGIKSGTDLLHGTLYAFGRDADLNTRNPFRPPPGSGLPGAGKTAYAMEQWGASVGGKIKKDKLFYFLNFERQRYNVGATAQINAPSNTDFSLPGGPGFNKSLSIPDAIQNMLSLGAPPTQLSLNLLGCGGLKASTLTSGTPQATINAGCSTAGTGGLSVFNNSVPGTFTQNVPFGANSVGGPDAGIAKIDYRINRKNAVNGDLIVENANSDGWTKVSTQPWWLIDSSIRMYIARGSWVFAPNANLTNEARFGMDWVKETTVPSDCAGVNGAPNYVNTFGLDTGSFETCEFPFVQVTGFTALSISPGAGPYTSQPRNYIGIDSVSWTHGKHLIRFGAEIHRGVFTGSGGGGTGPPIRGTITFGTTPAFTGATALQDFLAGVNTVSTVYVGSPTGITPNIDVDYYAGFIQDTYRLNRKLTIDLGLRYEYVPAFHQSDFLEGTLNFGNPTGLSQEMPGAPVWHADTWKHNFAPRGALAYDVFGNGRTVVRVVGNLMYAQPTYSGLSGPQNVPTGALFFNPDGTSFTNPICTPTRACITQGTVQTTGGILWNDCSSAGLDCATTPGAANTVFQNLFAKGLSCGDGLPTTMNGPTINSQPCAISVVNPNLYTPYITSWAANLQQALGKSVSLVVGYVGNHGTAIRQQVDINQPTPGLANANSCTTQVGPGVSPVYCQNNEQARRPFTTNCPTGALLAPGGTQQALFAAQTAGPCLPWPGQVLEVANSDVSNFDAFQASLSLRSFHGFTANLNYALQHCLDIFSNNENIWTILTNTRDPQEDYGTCATGTPQRITGNYSWAIPGKKTFAQMLQGWAINGTAIILPKRYVSLKDTTNDVTGTGLGQTSVPGNPWNIFGSPAGINSWGLGSNTSTVPCYSGPTGKFASQGCAVSSSNTSIGPGGICSADALLEPNSSVGTATQQLQAIGCYVENGTVMLPPARGTFGDMSRVCCLAPGFYQMDMSVTKTCGFLKEQRLKMQFRAEFFNILNHVNYAAIQPTNANLGSASAFGQETSTPNTGAQIVSGVGGEREVQFGLKFIW